MFVPKMKNTFSIIGFCLAWFAVIAQFVLMIQNRHHDVTETITRYFSFFTILTNILVALFFTAKLLKLKKAGLLQALLQENQQENLKKNFINQLY